MPYTGIDVVVPAHDEELLLGACLDALDACAAATPLPVTVTVVLDACSDGSAEIARGRAQVVHVDYRNVGAARAAGFSHAAALAASAAAAEGRGPGRRWLATTDADSRVPRTWLADQLRMAAAGADLVAGLVDIDDWSGWDPATRAAYLDGYSPVAGHRHVHGANLGFSDTAYARIGGFDPVAEHEDALFVRRARDLGLIVAWSGSEPVVTSARRIARSPGGFAGHLAAAEQRATSENRATSETRAATQDRAATVNRAAAAETGGADDREHAPTLTQAAS